MVYVVVGVYGEDEYICGVYGSSESAGEAAGRYTEDYDMAGFTYEVREFQVIP